MIHASELSQLRLLRVTFYVDHTLVATIALEV